MAEFFLDPLRLSLIAVAVSFIGGIYIYGRRLNRRPPGTEEENGDAESKGIYDRLYKDPELNARAEVGEVVARKPRLNVQPETAAEESVVEEPMAEELMVEEPTVEEPVMEEPVRRIEATERFVILHVVADEGEVFQARDLLPALREAGLVFGQHRIFHRPGPHEDRPLFSVASMVEPGYLEVTQWPDFGTPGLTMFMRAPSPLDEVEVFSSMLTAAHILAATLGGTILAQTKQPLTDEWIARIEEELAVFAPQRRVSSM